MPFASPLRSLVRSRWLSLSVVATIALGVAALTTTFGIVNAALFRQPPFHDAARLAMLYLERRPEGEPPRQERWSFARFQLLQQSQQSFEQIASYSPATITLAGDDGAELVYAERVSASYFSLLRVGASRGRLFTEDHDVAERPSPVAVLSHGLWTQRWNGDPGMVGRTIRLNGVPFDVIGVLPPGFAGLSGRAEVWIPRTVSPQVTYAEYLTTNQNFISAVGRLRTEVGLDAARVELAVLGAEINRALPSNPRVPQERVTATAVSINDARVDKTIRRSLLVLLCGVALLHLLACANVANLLLGRAAARQREYAMRVALGSSASRLFTLILGEGSVLAAVGGVLGILLATWTSALVAPPASAWRNFYGGLAPFDAPAFSTVEVAFGAGLAVATALLVALAPAMSAFRIDVSSAIKASRRSVAGGGLSLRRPSARGVIVGIEAALATLLVVAAGLLVDSFQRMQRAQIGVEPAHVLTFWVIPSEARIPPATAPTFIARLLDALTRVSGVQAASVDGGGPLSGTANSTLYIEGRPGPPTGQAPPVLRHYIAPDHFRTLGIPVRRGRVFTPADTATAPRVAVISETAARRFWPNEDPIGQRVWFGGGSSFNSPESSAEIVGIVADVVYEPLDRPPNFASFYTPYTQFTYASRMVFLRTAGNPMSVVPDVRRAIASVDPEIAMQDVRPLTDLVTGSWARQRFEAILFGGFGVAGLLLAASGIFAVLAYAVERRTHEFGIRMALGANPGRIVSQVLREGLAFPVIGVLAGLAASVAFTRVLQSSLYEISPLEPSVLIGMTALLLIVAALACLAPAWRATSADPIEALRSE
ncbi:MAG TPA: ABC transporter permease [Vicinamibacterales bacterium]|nr:ABC transporter permease [Vicinamibacterales bacterium]